MKVNHRGIRYFFRGLLAVILVVSVCIEIFIHTHTDDMFNPSIEPQTMQAAGQRYGNGVPLADADRKRGSTPGWRGEVQVTQQENGENEVTITNINSGGGSKPLTSFQVYLRSANGKDELDITDRFTKDASGQLKGSLKGMEAGAWTLRVRLNRPLSTLEFTQRIDVK